MNTIRNSVLPHPGRLLSFFVLFIALPLSGCQLDVASTLDAAGYALQAVTLSDSDVSAMGLQAAKEMDSQAKVAPDASHYAKRLKRLTANLEREDGLRLNFKVYLTDEINAFALPDGSIRVYAGLMDLMKDDNELLFVIGHEIGHVKNGDTRDRFRLVYTSSAARKVVEASGGRIGSLARSDIGNLAHGFINAQFSQAQELAADDYGFALLDKYNRPTVAAEHALRKLESRGASGSDLFSSHPDSGRRAERMAKRRTGR